MNYELLEARYLVYLQGEVPSGVSLDVGDAGFQDVDVLLVIARIAWLEVIVVGGEVVEETGFLVITGIDQLQLVAS